MHPPVYECFVRKVFKPISQLTIYFPGTVPHVYGLYALILWFGEHIRALPHNTILQREYVLKFVMSN